MHKLLHLLPPELAHSFAVAALKQGIGPRSKFEHPALRTDLVNIGLLGKSLVNPVGLSAGADKGAAALPGWSRMGFGFVEAGTVTLHPRKGNPKPRVWRMGDGQLVNWMGLPGEGLKPFIANLEKFEKMPERDMLTLGASIASPDGNLDELRQLALACTPLVDYMTINASCPNVAHGHGQDAIETVIRQIDAVVKSAAACPVFLKLGPTRDEESLHAVITAARQAGAFGFVLTNTAPFDKKDTLGGLSLQWPENNGKPVGGYSGPALLDTTCWMVKHARAILPAKVPIIGVGGIQSGDDAVRVMDAGANAVQLYTGLVYKGAALIDEIKEALVVRQAIKPSVTPAKARVHRL